ncbi:hypothetical protein [Chondromyces crocatus]|uniref:Uncharacterized protein n=1 Tax=Chondromyces crocatus TaxID=52 RepID=A0A0K1EII3_CHOCO|nr:hypothetical protein [Chondromyces crocatus]AKT40664.1 uncharacterized protein CMC5_048200 [Chondromyces crocatus]
MTKPTCPRCGSSIQLGASKCPACRQWIGPRPGFPLGQSQLFGIACALLATGAALGFGGAHLAGLLTFPADTDRAALAPAPAPSTSTSSVPDRVHSFPSNAAPSAPHLPPAARPSVASTPVPPDAARPATWHPPRTIPLGVVPRDIALTEDGATLLVLDTDGALHAIQPDAPDTRRRLPLPGRPARLHRLGPHHLVALDAQGPLPLIDLRTWDLTLLDAGGPASDALLLGQGRVLLTASATGRRVTRFIGPGTSTDTADWRMAGTLSLPRPPQQLGLVPGNPELVLMILPALDPSRPGTLELFDPRVEPLGTSRRAFALHLDPTPRLLPTAPSLDVVPADPHTSVPWRGRTLLDRQGSQLVHISPDALDLTLLAAAPEGRLAGVARLLDRYLILVDTAGVALVLGEPDGALLARLPLDTAPVATAQTPDGRTALIALAGRAAVDPGTLLILDGDPPTITARLSIGPTATDARIAVTPDRIATLSLADKSVCLIERR